MESCISTVPASERRREEVLKCVIKGYEINLLLHSASGDIALLCELLCSCLKFWLALDHRPLNALTLAIIKPTEKHLHILSKISFITKMSGSENCTTNILKRNTSRLYYLF